MITPYRFSTIQALCDEICRRPLEQYILVNVTDREVVINEMSYKRMEEVAADTFASLTYSYFYEELEDGSLEEHPVIDYQIGSVRDDFDFGPILLLNSSDVLAIADKLPDDASNYLDGGWYMLRLFLSVHNVISMIPEYLYSARRVDYRKSGEKQHDYVNPRQRSYQKEMEDVCTFYLEAINGLVDSEPFYPDLSEGIFPVEASIIIPVRNRQRTIRDAVESALSQKADFNFNVIVVNNCSTDETPQILSSINDPRLHIINPEPSEMLGIGGCWNKALLSEHCGKFAVQLDSDDIYADETTLSQIVECFYSQQAAMVVGSYMLTDFDLNVIPPGLIDHSEWTAENGANNALRINGFGAPRAYFTPIARELLFPNVSYGEDYAMCLRISRDYAVGRIMTPLYYCRRWEGNSDAALPIETVNRHNTYKDFLRSVEIIARVEDNESKDSEIIKRN